MKLPQILATTDVPVPSASTTAPDISGVAVAQAQGIGRLGEAVSGALLGYAEAEQKAAAVQAKADKAKRDQQVKIEAERTEALIEGRLNDLNSGLDTTVTDPDERMRQWTEGVAQIRSQSAQDFKYPETAAVIEQHWPDIFKRHYKTAIERRDALYKTDRFTDLGVTLDERRRLGGFEDFSPDGEAGAVRHYQKGLDALRSMAPLLGDKLIPEGVKFRDEFIGERAERDYRDDPDRFLARATTHELYRQMDPHKRNALVKAAEELSQTRARERVNGLEKFFKAVEEDAERERQGQLAVLSERGTIRRDLTPSDVVTARQVGLIQNGTEFEHYMTLATQKPKDAPSDPVIWSHVSGDVWSPRLTDTVNQSGDFWSPRPTYTANQIRGLMTAHIQGRPGLNSADGRMALNELEQKRNAAKSEHLQAENREYERGKDAYTRAKEEGDRALGITTPYSELDQPTRALAFQFLRELNARILDDKGNVRPGARDELYKILPSLLEQQSGEAKLRYDDQVKILGAWLQSPAPDPLDPAWIDVWYPTQQRAVEALRQTNPNLYAVRKQQLLDVLKQHQNVIGVQRRKSALPTTNRPATQYKPPGSP